MLLSLTIAYEVFTLTSRRTIIWTVLVIGLGVPAVSTVRAAQALLRGSYNGELYSWDDGVNSRMDVYQSLRLNISKSLGPGNRSWAFRTHARWRVPLGNDTLASSQLYIRDAYLTLNNVLNHMSLSLGRQFVYNALRSAEIDGLCVQYDPNRRVRIDVYGGGEVLMSDPETIASLGRRGIFGARIAGDATATLRVGASWMYRRTNGGAAYDRVGVDLTQQIKKAEVHGRGSWNLANNRLSELLARLTIAPKDWYFSGEYDWREPDVDANSLFSVVDFDRYRRARMEMRRRIMRQLWLFQSGHATFETGGTIWQGTLGVSGPGFSIGWSHQEGRGTRSNGLSGYLTFDLDDQWTVFGNSNLSRYRVQGQQVDQSDAYTAAAGIGWRPGKNWQVQLQGQFLRNAVNSSDARFLLQITKGFSAKLGGTGAGK